MFNCPYIQRSGKRIKNREAAVLQQKWELKAIVHKQGYKCLHAEHTANKSAIPSPLCQTGSKKPHLQPQKQELHLLHKLFQKVPLWRLFF